tara:strand:+ start:8474 stop:9253 length:780 start_codon:yes stop_codon:yes gene_type:complete
MSVKRKCDNMYYTLQYITDIEEDFNDIVEKFESKADWKKGLYKKYVQGTDNDQKRAVLHRVLKDGLNGKDTSIYNRIINFYIAQNECTLESRHNWLVTFRKIFSNNPTEMRHMPHKQKVDVIKAAIAEAKVLFNSKKNKKESDDEQFESDDETQLVDSDYKIPADTGFVSMNEDEVSEIDFDLFIQKMKEYFDTEDMDIKKADSKSVDSEPVDSEQIPKYGDNFFGGKLKKNKKKGTKKNRKPKKNESRKRQLKYSKPK